MLIINLSHFSNSNFLNLDNNLVKYIDTAFRDSENLDIYSKFDLNFELIKYSHENIPNYFQAHKLKLKLIFILSGKITLQSAHKNQTSPLKVRFENEEYEYFISDQYHETTNLIKGDLIIIDSNDLYKIISNDNFSKLIISKIL
jgi:hypothetical protein